MANNKKNQSQINSEFLHAAYTANLPALVKAALDGADVNAVHEQTGLRAIHLAVGTNNLLMTRYLLDQCGAEYAQDRSGRWPTLIAAECSVGDALSDYIVDKECEYAKYLEKIKSPLPRP